MKKITMKKKFANKNLRLRRLMMLHIQVGMLVAIIFVVAIVVIASVRYSAFKVIHRLGKSADWISISLKNTLFQQVIHTYIHTYILSSFFSSKFLLHLHTCIHIHMYYKYLCESMR